MFLLKEIQTDYNYGSIFNFSQIEQILQILYD